MPNEVHTTIIGNLTDAPELRFTASGNAVANFTIASTPRVYDKQAGKYVDGEPLFMRCSVWRDTAEHLTESLGKGARVIAHGRLKQRSFETKQGEKRTVVELDVDDIGPSVRFATASVQKATRSRPAETDPFTAMNHTAADPWTVPATDEPPF